MTNPFAPLRFPRSGHTLPNRFMLAPLTNSQSHADGTLSDEELHWLTMRADGGFGSIMTAAAHVQPVGQGFPGQIGAFSDAHIPGLRRLADELRARGAVSIVQLYHGGHRSPAALLGQQPVCPSDDPKTGARGLSNAEVKQLVADFVAGAKRCEAAGMDGVELHGAHGYILCQFLDAALNRRDDEYGGPLENRARLLLEVIAGIREACGSGFILGVRLSPERFGMHLGEIQSLSQQLMREGAIDFLDVSLWDCFKQPYAPEFQGRTLASYFTELDRGEVRLGFAGKLHTPTDVQRVLDDGADFVLLGRAAILHHDFPNAARANPEFVPVQLPVTVDYLYSQGLAPSFVQYMRRWEHFIADAPAAAE